MTTPAPPGKASSYSRYLLLIAGLGGLLYGIDVGIIAGALPYLEATSGLNAGQLSLIVAAVLLGSVISTLFAGFLSDLFGRKALMITSGVMFIVSIPMIALAHGFGPLIAGRLLQGVSAGFIGVVVPLYLAECLNASNRGKGTGIFQWLLTLGIVAAAVIGYGFSLHLHGIEQAIEGGTKSAQDLFSAKDFAWRSIFWVSILPGILFTLGAFFLSESPRWSFKKGRTDAALKALLRDRSEEQARLEIKEMGEHAEAAKSASGATKLKDSLLSRKYVIPFILACVILACNQATGVNSIIGYNSTILIQGGLNDQQAHLGYVIFTVVNFLMTMGALALVDKKGRKFLLTLGSSGIIVSLLIIGFLFSRTEKQRVDCKEIVQRLVKTTDKEVENADGSKTTKKDETVEIAFNQEKVVELLTAAGKDTEPFKNGATLNIIYSVGDFTSASTVVRSDDKAAKPLSVGKLAGLPSSSVEAFFKNPFASLDRSQHASLKIENALLTPIPSTSNGWLVASFTYVFIAFFAVGPGVCVWLALSELMPTRIRSNGMSIALLVNQAVSTTIAAVFLPMVGKHGYGTLFYCFAGFTVVYFIAAAFFLPETKGKTLEEIEEHFEGKKKA
ncbi:MFS transporter [Luteolibacter ambystomatis]|uniref:MFS transporter n=1 Tax=Luteolibacter ambystomatis TaxID=2824561 RepID=A0A975G5U0_9BACT|nr:MFS transporter [Luteolibacter ambystomatis]QUE49872.1 MFS transporter [Luteolibacter ambystomatis]